MDVVIVGQLTVDHVVPPSPAAWTETIGGNALYAAAGARLWSAPERIGVVARVGRGLPVDVAALLRAQGLPTAGLRPVEAAHLVEWLVYETDGSRRSLPRDPELRESGTHAATLRQRYLARLEAVSASADEVPPEWLPAAAVHLAPQVEVRHRDSARRLRGGTAFLSVDPSPHYAVGRDAKALATLLAGVDALLPSEAEVAHLSAAGAWDEVAARLVAAGFPEVAIKRGAHGCLVGTAGAPSGVCVPAAPARVVELTGAGDAFCGAYAVSRGRGLDPVEASRRAVVAAAMVVECRGAAAALALSPAEARRRLDDLEARR
jgi:ribokinase